jgi:hypothetical protein
VFSLLQGSKSEGASIAITGVALKRLTPTIAIRFRPGPLLRFFPVDARRAIYAPVTVSIKGLMPNALLFFTDEKGRD